MNNVKELLQSWKHDLAHADGLLGTDHETLNEQEFENLESQIQDLEGAITRDERMERQHRIEEDEFNSHLNITKFQL